MSDDTITRDQFQIALYVLETLRDELLPEGEVGKRRHLNEAHYTLQEWADNTKDDWDMEDEERVSTTLSLRQMVRCTEAMPPYERGYDLVGAEWVEGGMEFTWELAEGVRADGRGEDERPAEPATPDDVPETCELSGCDVAVENFTEAFFPPEEFIEDVDSEGRVVMCDAHHVAARILTYTREEPPYVDIGLYQEVTYYSRALAATMFDIDPEEKVVAPQNAGDE